MKIDLDLLAKNYFYFDEPVPYPLNNDTILPILPISVRNSEIFLSSVDIINIDKNISDSVEIIQMSYLRFLLDVVQKSDALKQKLVNILVLCMGLKKPNILVDENNKAKLVDKELGIEISAKQFDDIKRIIMYQNIIHYDDEYVNPEFKKAMDEVDTLKNRNIVMPSLERKMAIITAHCGLSKQEQKNMTYRSLSLLFEEVSGEVEFTTTRPIALYGGQGDKIDHWIYKKAKGKFDGYYTLDSDYNKSMGGDGYIKTSSSNTGSELTQKFESFTKK